MKEVAKFIQQMIDTFIMNFEVCIAMAALIKGLSSHNTTWVVLSLIVGLIFVANCWSSYAKNT